MSELIKLRLSVHNLVDFLLRTGSIDTRVFNKDSMSEGTRLHALYQKKQTTQYLSEYPLEHTFEVDNFLVTLQGRADGIIGAYDYFIIDEIKSTVIDVNDFFKENETWHLGQAKCYALMYALEQDLDDIGVRLTYLHQSNQQKLVKDYRFSRDELDAEIHRLIALYLNFFNIIYKRQLKRDSSVKKLHFPYSSFRSGQKKLARYAFATLKQGGSLYVEAPTGIGKTMSTLYPAVQTFSVDQTDKIFYLTAKTSGQEAAFSAVLLLKEQGLEATPIVITAKDKICPHPGTACNPDECPFAKDYYSKIRDVLTEMVLKEDVFTPEIIQKYAKKYTICPFELELDLSLYSDIIICDYNYLFDPLVYMRRYFDEDGANYVALIDEAHNLVERARDMYSASLSLSSLQAAKKDVRNIDYPKIKKAFRLLNKDFAQLLKTFPSEQETVIEGILPIMIRHLNDFILAGQEVMRNFSQSISDAFIDFFFKVNRLLKMLDFVDETYITYISHPQEKDIEIHLFNLDPSQHVRRNLLKIRSRILFSATLSPIDYYVKLLGGMSNDPILLLPNPFPVENRLLMIAPTIATTFKKRDDTYGEVADYIESIILGAVGNYLIFFPSYRYLMAVESYLWDLSKKHDFAMIVQTSDMKNEEKEAFLMNFRLQPTKTMLGLAVLGGAFSEGIDLRDDRLIGAVIVGIGLPQISFERDLIRSYYDDHGLNGFDYSYTNPGMNRVMQAVGRVIRSEQDHGVVLLIDDRYLRRQYRDLFKREWDNYEVVTSVEDIATLVGQFWTSRRS